MGSSGAAAGSVIQIFGRNDSRGTRHCLRFFKERRLGFAFVDLAKRGIAAAELRRFSDRFGAAALLDSEGKAYRKAGLAYMRMDEAEMLERILSDPRLLRLPLVRWGRELSVGVDEEAWRMWLSRG